MNTREKMMIGALGALTPVLMNLLVVDLDVLRLKLTILTWVSYFLKAAVLIYLGGLVAYLHKDENSPVKLFELGMVAPALIGGFINAQQRELPKLGSAASLLPSVYAQHAPVQSKNLKTFSYPTETFAEQVQRGLFGSLSSRVWFVIVGSHLKVEDAEKQAREITQKSPQFKPEVYAPYGQNPYHAVVIGANLTRKEAFQLLDRAKKAGLTKEPYLWTFPR